MTRKRDTLLLSVLEECGFGVHSELTENGDPKLILTARAYCTPEQEEMIGKIQRDTATRLIERFGDDLLDELEQERYTRMSVLVGGPHNGDPHCVFPLSPGPFYINHGDLIGKYQFVQCEDPRLFFVGYVDQHGNVKSDS